MRIVLAVILPVAQWADLVASALTQHRVSAAGTRGSSARARRSGRGGVTAPRVLLKPRSSFLVGVSHVLDLYRTRAFNPRAARSARHFHVSDPPCPRFAAAAAKKDAVHSTPGAAVDAPARRTSHVAPRTPHVARRTSHLAPRTSHLAPRTSHVARRTSHVARRTSHVERCHWRRRMAPGFAPVCSPFFTTATPLTKTCGMPVA